MNLFLTKMFYKTSFKAWLHSLKNHLNKQMFQRAEAAKKDFCERNAMDYVAEEYSEPIVQTEEVHIEYETMLELSCSDEEFDDNETKSMRSRTTHKLLSQKSRSKSVKSPEIFRLQAKLRMTSSSKKFNLVIDEA